MKVLVIGAGPTGSLVAHLLRKCMSSSHNVAVTIWEKSAGCGGRMSTSRFPADALGEACSVDIGAQYISNIERYQQPHSQFYDELKESSVLTSMGKAEIIGAREETTTKNYYCSEGINSISKWFIAQSEAELCVKTRLESITLQSDGILATNDAGRTDMYDYVVLTIPAPQILALTGIDYILETEERSMLEDVSYSSRFALAIKLPSDFAPPISWTAMYIDNNPCVRYVCLDSRKKEIDGLTTILVHTSAAYGIQNLERDKYDKALVDDIFNNVCQLLPWLPESSCVLRCHKWRYSQVREAVPGEPGFLSVRSTPKLLFCGDAFTHSNLDGCISSALKTVGHLQSLFTTPATSNASS